MKRLKFAFLLTATCSFFFVSCSKQYACSCVSNYGDGASAEVAEVIAVSAMDQSSADAECTNLNEYYDATEATGYFYQRTCTAVLKN